MTPKIILASKSPRRKHLLELAQIEFEIATQDTDESFPDDLEINQIPVFIAKQKALAVLPNFPTQTIIGADTIVVLNNKIIGKPIDRNDAISTLKELSGNTHTVITGVCILIENKIHSFYDTTEVSFNELTLEQIEFYVDSCKPYDKAGAYAIQEWIGAVGIKSINGCFYNVMGLPISRLIIELKQLI